MVIVSALPYPVWTYWCDYNRDEERWVRTWGGGGAGGGRDVGEILSSHPADQNTGKHACAQISCRFAHNDRIWWFLPVRPHCTRRLSLMWFVESPADAAGRHRGIEVLRRLALRKDELPRWANIQSLCFPQRVFCLFSFKCLTSQCSSGLGLFSSPSAQMWLDVCG